MTDLRRRCAVASVLAAMAAAVLDASSMNLALPSISDALGIEPSDTAWLVIAYQAALMVSLLPIASIGDQRGSRQTFISGVCLFAACALTGMLARSFELLIILRMLQGVGAAAIMSLGVALLRQSVAPDELGRAIGWNAMTVALMSAAGPIIGAALLSFGSWRFVFLGGVALSAVSLGTACALPFASTRLRSLNVRATASYVAIVSSFVVAVGLVYILPRLSILLLLSAMLGFWAFVRRDRRLKSPFLPLDLLGNPTFNRSVLASVTCFTGLSVGLLMLPFALHEQSGAAPLEIAMLMSPWPLAVLLTTPLTTWLLSRYEPAKLCSIGGICMSVGFATLVMAPSASSTELYLPGIFLCGTGFGLFQTPNNRSMLLAVPVERAASAGGMQATARLSGQLIGALIGSLLLSSLTVLTASRYGFGLAAATTVIASVISVRRVVAKTSEKSSI